MTTAQFWGDYARTKPSPRETNAAGERTWFNWTQYPEHGPGEEILCRQGFGMPERALELGCGSGRNIAHLAGRGVTSVGLDLSDVQLSRARAKWGDVEHLHFVQMDATEFLGKTEDRYDAVFSIFGALWFTDPAVSLPLVHEHLNPGGVLAFSHAPAIDGCYGAQGAYKGDFAGAPPILRRWAYTPQMWTGILLNYGFVDVSAVVLPAPHAGDLGTLHVRAVRI
ncbi:trans-aconitate 2-methyltransferase [Streptomyces sp. GESEQ-4]|uniref:class I SAM-dependent methyltransferase n=1 Tax=Streptomyces sp. GESEQ-4 TaxID=2812655 RepID=UPI001B32D18F|nr:class I SAM-dependent methyltransferase [Streptomyces sp. GESEQ-4]